MVHKLPPNSIDSFTTLVLKFETQFAPSRLHHLNSIALVGLRQEKGELLRTFIDRIKKMEISVQNFSPDVAMHLMLETLRLRPFTDNLCMQPTTSLDELRKRATKFMQLEELREFRKHALAEASGEKNKDEKECQGRLGHRGDRRRDNRGSRFSRYTPLMVERGRILDKALNVEPIPHPRKAANPSNMDRRKQCRYHQNSGHSTEECQAFKDKIDELIQARHRAGSLGVAETRGIPLAGTSPLKVCVHLQEHGMTEIAETSDGLGGTTLHEEMIPLGRSREGETERSLTQ